MRILTTALIATLAVSIVHGEDKILRVDGSNGARPLFRVLLDAFAVAQPAIKTELGEGMSTSERLKALERGEIQLASASHGIEAERLEPYDAVALSFAKMAVVFAVHETAGISDLSFDELCSIYQGEITNWKALGGADLKIVCLMRPEDEVDTEIVRARIPGMANLKWGAETKFPKKSGEMADALSSTHGAIGVTSLIRALNGSNLEVISLDGVHPVGKRQEKKRYLLYRKFYVVLPPEPSEGTFQFLDFLDSSSAAKAVAENHAEYSASEIKRYLSVR